MHPMGLNHRLLLSAIFLLGLRRLDLLAELASRAYLSVEYGMQTMHDRSLDWMNRGHHHDSFVDAVHRSVGRGFEICAHVILGLPNETLKFRDFLDGKLEELPGERPTMQDCALEIRLRRLMGSRWRHRIQSSRC